MSYLVPTLANEVFFFYCRNLSLLCLNHAMMLMSHEWVLRFWNNVASRSHWILCLWNRDFTYGYPKILRVQWGAPSVDHRFTYLYPMAALVMFICPFPLLATIPGVQDAKVAGTPIVTIDEGNHITCCSTWKAEACTLYCVPGPLGCQRQLLRQCSDKTTNPLNQPPQNHCRPVEVARCSRYVPEFFPIRWMFSSMIQANQPKFRLKASSLLPCSAPSTPQRRSKPTSKVPAGNLRICLARLVDVKIWIAKIYLGCTQHIFICRYRRHFNFEYAKFL